jgi:hypothetical protein
MTPSGDGPKARAASPPPWTAPIRTKDVGLIRIMFPDAPNSHHDNLVEITWEEFFQEFEDKQLALVFDEKSLFNKLIGRDTAEKREHGDHKAAR